MNESVVKKHVSYTKPSNYSMDTAGGGIRKPNHDINTIVILVNVMAGAQVVSH